MIAIQAIVFFAGLFLVARAVIEIIKIILHIEADEYLIDGLIARRWKRKG